MKRRLIIFMMLAFAVCLCACKAPSYSNQEKKEYLEKGKVLISGYLDENGGDYKLNDVSLVEGQLIDDFAYDSGRNLTYLVKGSFEKNGESYLIYADISNGTIYTDALSFDIKEAYKNVISRELKKAGFDSKIYVADVDTSVNILCENIPYGESTISTIATIKNVYPTTFSQGDAEEYLLEGMQGGDATVSGVLFTDDATDLNFETWKAYRSNCDKYRYIHIYVTDTDSLNRSIEKGYVDAGMYLNLSAHYIFGNEFKEYRYTMENFEDIYVLYADLGTVYEEDGNVTKIEMNAEFTETEKTITVEIGNNGSGYLLFKGDKDYENLEVGLLNTMLSDDQEPTMYRYKFYGDGFYTLGTSNEDDQPWLFSKVKISK